MSGDHLVRQVHDNLVEAFAVLPPYQPAGFVHRSGGVMVAATGSPVAFFNEVVPFADDVDPDALAAAAGIVEAAGLPWMAHLRDGIDDRLVDTLHHLGLVEAGGDYPAMVLTSIPAEVPVPSGAEVVRVAQPADFEVHVNVAAVLGSVDVDRCRTWLGDGLVDNPAVAMFVGYSDGTPAAISMCVRTGDVVGVYNVGTVPSARRRGIGWAMTAAAITAGAEMGATVAVLQSSPMAASMYEAHGFRRLFQYRLFHQPN